MAIDLSHFKILQIMKLVDHTQNRGLTSTLKFAMLRIIRTMSLVLTDGAFVLGDYGY